MNQQVHMAIIYNFLHKECTSRAFLIFIYYGIIYYINKKYRRIKDNMEQTKKFGGPKKLIYVELHIY